MNPSRIPFKVADCSSEDEGYSCLELLSPGPGCKGWRSDQYCTFPQYVILQMESRSSLERLQFMMHHSMVATSMEIWLGDVPDKNGPPDLKKVLFQKLGNLDWGSNREHSSSGGRQMQTVELEGGASQALFVKLVLKKNHINRQNEYNQVSLVGINFLGRFVEAPQEEDGARKKKAHREDLAFLMYTDPDIVEIINQLEDRRIQAQHDGRDEYAKKLRRAIRGLEEAGQELGVEVALKRRAIDRQAYDEAKARKSEIDLKREAIYREYNVSDLLELTGQVDANDDRYIEDDRPSELPPATKHKTKPRTPSSSPKADRSSRRESFSHHQPTPPRSPRLEPLPPPPIKKSPSRKVRSATPTRLAESGQLQQSRRQSLPELSPIQYRGIEDEEAKSSKISAADRNELQAAIDVYGEKTVEQILNRKPAAKTAAAEEVRRQLNGYRPEDHPGIMPGYFMRGTAQILKRMIRDKVWAVFSQGIDIHTDLYSDFLSDHKVPRKDLDWSTTKVYGELLVRAGDTQERVQDKAEDAIELMLRQSKVERTGLIQAKLLELPLGGPKESPKVTLTRAELVLFMVKDLKGAGEPTKKLMDFGLSALAHPNASVRKLSERILLALYAIDPEGVRKRLPEEAYANKKKSDNSALKKLVEEFDKRDRRA